MARSLDSLARAIENLEADLALELAHGYVSPIHAGWRTSERENHEQEKRSPASWNNCQIGFWKGCAFLAWLPSHCLPETGLIPRRTTNGASYGITGGTYASV